MSDQHGERIDAALHALREAQAPEGMVERVLAVVRTREAAAASSRKTSPAAGWFGERGGLVWSGVAVAVVVLAGLLAVSRREMPAAGHSVADGAPRQGSSVRGDASGMAERKHVAERKAVSATPALRVRQARSSLSTTRDVAYSDADLPSFPAPPAPLTQEERLLLRVARSGDRMELAMLDPEIRSARVEDEKAEVRKFFGEVTEKEIVGATDKVTVEATGKGDSE